MPAYASKWNSTPSGTNGRTRRDFPRDTQAFKLPRDFSGTEPAPASTPRNGQSPNRAQAARPSFDSSSPRNDRTWCARSDSSHIFGPKLRALAGIGCARRRDEQAGRRQLWTEPGVVHSKDTALSPSYPQRSTPTSSNAPRQIGSALHHRLSPKTRPATGDRESAILEPDRPTTRRNRHRLRHRSATAPSRRPREFGAGRRSRNVRRRAVGVTRHCRRHNLRS
jgi:hypothetical protein